MFTKKKVPTLMESAALLVEKSQGIKSVFSKMKDDLEDTNISLDFEKEKIDELLVQLSNSKASLEEEKKTNEKVIVNIDKIIK